VEYPVEQGPTERKDDGCRAEADRFLASGGDKDSSNPRVRKIQRFLIIPPTTISPRQ
jgi:hypothetical protein